MKTSSLIPAQLGEVKAFWLVVILLVSLLFPAWLIWNHWPESLGSDSDPIPEALLLLSVYMLMLAFLGCVARAYRVKWSMLAPYWPHKSEIVRCGVLGIPMVATAVTCIYVLYLPLSYVWPDFVSSWLLEDNIPTIWPSTDLPSIVASVGNVIAAVLLAPIAEEILFRGFLLNRCRRVIGAIAAILLTSALFAALHVDYLGAFLFGIIVSVHYLRSGSLIGAIIIHIANNAVAVLFELGGNLLYPADTLTLGEFQALWWLPVVTGIVGFPWLIVFWRQHLMSVQEPEQFSTDSRP